MRLLQVWMPSKADDRSVRVWADPVLLTAGFQARDAEALPRIVLREDQALLGACVIDGHSPWVALCWRKVAGFVFAKLVLFTGCFAHSAGEGLRVFRFRDAMPRVLPPGLCGHAALIDLRAYLCQLTPRPYAEVAAQATKAHVGHVQALLPGPWSNA